MTDTLPRWRKRDNLDIHAPTILHPVTDRHKGAGDDRHNGATYLVGKTDIPVGQEWVDFEPLATRAEAPAGATLGLRRDLPSNSMQ